MSRLPILILALIAGGAGSRALASSERPGQLAAALAPADRARLEALVERARREQPEAFSRVLGLRGIRPELYSKTRARRPEVVRELRGLGPAALGPMVEVALHGLAGARLLSLEERRALERGLVDVLGELGDARVAPLLRAAFEGADDPQVAEGAAIAVGKECGAEALALLLARSQPGEPRRAQAIEGLGWCRRPPSVERLAAILAAGDPEASRAARALGTTAASWAWATGVVGDPETHAEVARLAADALVRAAGEGTIPVEELAGPLGMLERTLVTQAVTRARVGADPVRRDRLDRLRLPAR